MANNYTDYMKNLMLEVVPSVLYISVHEVDPTGVGSNEVVGVDRVAVNFDAADAGVRLAQEAFVDLQIPSGSEIAFVGLFTALTAGNFVAYAPVLDGAGDPTTITFTQDLPFRVADVSLDLNNV